jgi:hypothetical protein
LDNPKLILAVFRDHAGVKGALVNLQARGITGNEFAVIERPAQSIEDITIGGGLASEFFHPQSHKGLKGVISAFSQKGVPELECQIYAEAVQRNHPIVAVICGSREIAQSAVNALDEHGAVDLGELSSQWWGETESWNKITSYGLSGDPYKAPTKPPRTREYTQHTENQS